MDRDALKLVLSTIAIAGLGVPVLFRIPHEITSTAIATAGVSAYGRKRLAEEDENPSSHAIAASRALDERQKFQILREQIEWEAIHEAGAVQATLDLAETFREGPVRDQFIRSMGLGHLLEPAIAPAMPPTELQSDAVVPGGLMDQASAAEMSEADFKERMAGDNWIPVWAARSLIICGKSGDGKTTLLVWLLSEWIKAHGDKPGATVYIGDTNYMQSHGNAPPNTWLGLKRGKHIEVEPLAILKQALGMAKIVKDRMRETVEECEKQLEAGVSVDQLIKPQFGSAILVIDEFPAVAEALDQIDGKHRTALVGALRTIVDEGLKQNVRVLLGSQDLTAANTFATSLLRKLNPLVLGGAAKLAVNFQNLGLQPNRVAEIAAAMVDQPREIKGVGFPAVLCTDGDPRVVIVPKIKLGGAAPGAGGQTPPPAPQPPPGPAPGAGGQPPQPTPASRRSPPVSSAPPPGGQTNQRQFYEECLHFAREQRINLIAPSEKEVDAIALWWRQATQTQLEAGGLELLIQMLQQLDQQQ